MKPAAKSLEHADFSVRKLPLKNQLTGQHVSRYDSALWAPKISILDALPTHFHEKSGLAMVSNLNLERPVNKSNVCHVLVILNGTTESIERVVELRNFDKEAFIHQLDVPKQSDPEMLDRYVIGPDDVSFIEYYLTEPVAFDFSSLGYWIEAVTRD